MNAERLKQIEKIYHAVLEVLPNERENFFKDYCGEDIELRREVESLLSFDETFDDFIDSSPSSFITEIFYEEEHESSRINKKIGHYNVKKLLGKGGMGEVYLAEDTKLNRKVAIKLLPPSVSGDKNRLRRFEQEAFAASALNHPNILTIYEFSVENGTYFLVTEFVEGQTLREVLNRNELKLKDIFNIAEQTAFALSAAHKARIIHRDIKPENIMLRDDGIVKVLDFGLAKLINPELSVQSEPSDFESVSGSKQLSLANTNSSGVMGTVAYMSPEQVCGLANIDGRTDIWSLGVVLYEMLTGKPPFWEEVSNELVTVILKGEFLPIKKYLPGILTELEELVGKLLRVDRTERYQNINELLVDLRNLKDEWNFQSKLDQSLTPSDSNETIKNTHQLAVQQTGGKRDNTFSTNKFKTTSSAVYFFETLKLRRYSPLAALFVSGFLLISGFIYFQYFSNYSQTKTLKSATGPINQMRIPTVGDLLETAISPDGKFLLYTAKENKKYSLKLKRLAENKTITLIAPSETVISGPTFSPDGNNIFYLQVVNPKISLRTLFKVSMLGGLPEKIIDDVDSAVSFSPDGNEITFRRNSPQNKESNIIIAKADGSSERVLAVRKYVEEAFCNNPVWSPDGKTIASIATEKTNDAKPYMLFAINVADGSQTKIGSSQWRWTTYLQWLPEGNELLLNVTDTPGGFTQFWRASFPEGKIVKVTNDYNRYGGASLTADSSLLATTLSRQNVDVYVAPLDNLANFKRIRSIAGDSYYGLDWTPNGKIVFSTNSGGNRDIWMMDADGSNPHQITNDNFVNYDPVVTRDGRFIVYSSERSGKYNIWRMNLDGSNPVQITKGSLDMDPTVTPDSRWVIYVDPTLQKISIDGGESTQLYEQNGALPKVTHDGRFIAYRYLNNRTPYSFNLAVLPISGGDPVKSFGQHKVMWQWLGDSLVYTDNSEDSTNLLNLSTKTGQSKQLTNFNSENISAFAISKDEKQIAFIRGSIINEVVILKNFR